MDFAKRILNKYGWKEGDGLGKNNDGMAQPLKAKLKFDNAGLGANQADSDFNNHWWERVFNEAAQNVQIKKCKDGIVSMDLKHEDDSVEISTKGYSLKKLKKAKATGGKNRSDVHYENFLQSSTLTKSGDEVENPNKIAVHDIAVTQFKVLSDEELFKACGGRTAHKGARHGLKLSGKLSRIEQQERELLAKMQQKQGSTDKEVALSKPKKKKQKSEDRDTLQMEHNESTQQVENDELIEVKKAKKKRKSKEVSEPHEEETAPKKKKKNKEQQDVEQCSAEVLSKKLKKKKKEKLK